MHIKLAYFFGVLVQGAVIGVSLYVAIVMLWVQVGDGQVFQYQGF